VVPTGYRRPVLDRVQDDVRRREVEALLAAAIPEFYAAYVVHQGGVWLLADDGAGRVTTTAIAAPPEPEAPLDPKAARKKAKQERRDKKKRGKH
jgi:hypothetical protein